MLRNYFTIAFRNIMRYKGYSFINIFGFAVGLACCLLIVVYTYDELSYDRFNEKADRIYRLPLRGRLNNLTMNGSVSCSPLAGAVTREIPGVETATRVKNYGFPVIRYKDKVFSEERVFFVDSTFFDVFTVKFIRGSAATALFGTHSLAITRSMAKKYFGDEDPIDKILNFDNRNDYRVTAILEDPPPNTHFHYDFLVTIGFYADSRNPVWVGNSFYTYIVLKKGVNPDDVQKNLEALTKKYVAPQMKQFLGLDWETLIARGAEYRYYLQPMLDIHLKSNLDFEIEPNGDINNVYVFSIIAFGIFVVACINYINLATARAMTRAKEISIRKTLGSDRGQLIQQFMSETFVATALAFLAAIILAALVQPLFNELADKQTDLRIFTDPGFLAIVAGMLVVSTILAGAYPAVYLASFEPTAVLSRSKMGGRKNVRLRSWLVVFQFAVSITLIICTLTVYNQMMYIKNKNLGFNKDQIILIKKTDDIGQQIASFKQELLRNPNIISASNAASVMGEQTGNTMFRYPGPSGVKDQMFWVLAADEDFASVFDIKLATGRYYEKNRPADAQNVVLNESAVKALDMQDPIGKIITRANDTTKLVVIGVVKDFHYQSLHEEIKPLLIFKFRPTGFGRFMPVKVKAQDLPQTLSFIETTWRNFAKGQAFEYTFFDEHFARFFLAEMRSAHLFLAFSILAVVIGCLGLFGLAAFMIEQRTKEIGVRKVLGAEVSTLVMLLTRQFALWVGIANLIAWPAAYFIMNKWLQNFAYRIELDPWIFLGAGVLALAVAMATVSWQAVKTARANPVTSLRYE